MACCGKQCAKNILLMGNLLFLLAGMGLVASGAYVRYTSKDYNTILGDKGMQSPANFVIVAGIFVFFLAFLGFCGACTENQCLLLTYICLVILIVLVEIGCVAFTFIYRQLMKQYVKNAVALAIQKSYKAKGYGPVTLAIDAIQYKMKCCGADGVKDYANSDWVLNNKKQNITVFPISCVDHSKKHNGTVFHVKGCVDVMNAWASSNLLICGGLAAGILLIELFAITFATVVNSKGQCQRIDVDRTAERKVEPWSDS